MPLIDIWWETPNYEILDGCSFLVEREASLLLCYPFTFLTLVFDKMPKQGTNITYLKLYNKASVSFTHISSSLMWIVWNFGPHFGFRPGPPISRDGPVFSPYASSCSNRLILFIFPIAVYSHRTTWIIDVCLTSISKSPRWRSTSCPHFLRKKLLDGLLKSTLSLTSLRSHRPPAWVGVCHTTHIAAAGNTVSLWCLNMHHFLSMLVRSDGNGKQNAVWK